MSRRALANPNANVKANANADANKWDVEKVLASLSVNEKVALLTGNVSVLQTGARSRHLAYRHSGMVAHSTDRWQSQVRKDERWSVLLCMSAIDCPDSPHSIGPNGVRGESCKLVIHFISILR